MTEPFFAPRPEPEPEVAPEPYYPDEPSQPPLNEVAVVLASALELARTGDTWVGLTHLSVHSRGVMLEIAARLRPGTEGSAHGEHSRRHHPGVDDLRLGVQLADGTSHDGSLGWVGGQRGTGEDSGLASLGLESGGLVRRQTLWLHPVPTEGPVHLVCQWESRDIPETHIELDVDALQAAAAGVEVLWPMPPRQPPIGGWFAYGG